MTFQLCVRFKTLITPENVFLLRSKLLVKKPYKFMKIESSLLFYQEPTTGTSPEPETVHSLLSYF